MWYNEINHDGKGYTVDDVGRLWQDILPVACTAEDEALQQLRAGTSAASAANFNGYVECIAIGLDNDCTGATVGSIVGAMVGIDGIPTHWYDRFHDTIKTYITDHGTFSIEDAVDRFVALNQ